MADEREGLHEAESADGSATLLLDRHYRIKLPEDSPIIARVCTVAHQGTHGHHTPTETLDRAKEAFHWDGMADTLTAWCRKCLQCIKLAKGPRIPRPMGHQLVATQPMEVVALDFLDLTKSRCGKYKAVLVIVDQLTRVCRVVATEDKTAATAASVFHERWLCAMPDPAFLITDGGTHFRCELFRQLKQLRGFEHHIVAPFCQWGNGGVEGVVLLLRPYRTDV